MLYVEVPQGEDPETLAIKLDTALGKISADFDRNSGYLRIFARDATQPIKISGYRKEVRDAVAALGLTLLS